MWDQEDPGKVCPIYTSLIPKYLGRFNTNYILFVAKFFMELFFFQRFFFFWVNENRE
jgi:hypothetical protein